MKIRALFLILILLSSPLPAMAGEDEAFALYELCKDERNKRAIIECVSNKSWIFQAYNHLYPRQPNLVQENPDFAWDYVRLEALYNIPYRPDLNTIRLGALKHAAPLLDASDFITLYEKAILWAQKEMDRDANDLYKPSKSIANEVHNEKLQNHFIIHYLDTAEHKGHIVAGIEASALWKEFDKDIEESLKESTKDIIKRPRKEHGIEE